MEFSQKIILNRKSIKKMFYEYSEIYGVKLVLLRLTGLYAFRARWALQGSVRLGHSLRSFPRLTPPTFCRPCKCCAFAYSGRQNVVNSRDVMRNTTQHFCKILWKYIDKNKITKYTQESLKDIMKFSKDKKYGIFMEINYGKTDT
jgi:hypothetical protein